MTDRTTFTFRARGRGGHLHSSPRRPATPPNHSKMASVTRSSSFSETMQLITSIKLQELEKQRVAYRNHSKVLEQVRSLDDDLIAKVEILLEAVRAWAGSGAVDRFTDLGGKLSISNIELWLPQAKKDPSFSPDILRSWINALETYIRHNLMRFDCVKLFGNLFNEWLASGDSSTSMESNDAASETGSDFVDIGRKEKHEQLDRFTSLIFNEASIDTDRLRSYLEDLFSSEEAVKVLEILRKRLGEFGLAFGRKKIVDSDVRNAISGLLASGLMHEGKRATLAEFLENPIIITEVASVLNMRMASLDTWCWPVDGLMVEMRRHLNGKYR